MVNDLCYILGLDVGVGSIGWAVIDSEKKRIVDFGARLFDSGELPRDKSRKSQKRRLYRSARRRIRRRSYRKTRLKQYLEKIGLVKLSDIQAYYEGNVPDVLPLRVKGLNEKLSPVELAAALIHISNFRGQRDFYEIDPETMTPEELKENEKEHVACANTETLMTAGNYRTAAEMYLLDKAFETEWARMPVLLHGIDLERRLCMLLRVA
jgi:CRISPR-associated endonuclease Csn1